MKNSKPGKQKTETPKLGKKMETSKPGKQNLETWKTVILKTCKLKNWKCGATENS